MLVGSRREYSTDRFRALSQAGVGSTCIESRVTAESFRQKEQFDRSGVAVFVTLGVSVRVGVAVGVLVMVGVKVGSGVFVAVGVAL